MAPSIAPTATLNASERRAVARFVELLHEELGARLHAVWLYGSRARGEPPGPDSDIDLLVIADGGRADDLIVSRLAWRAAEEANISPLVLAPRTYDPARVEDRRRIRAFFFQEVDRDKIVLYGSP